MDGLTYESVVVKPLIKLSRALAPRYEAATSGVPTPMERNPAIVTAFAPRREALMRCLPGKLSGLEDILPANLKNATSEPVKVIPPVMISAHINVKLVAGQTYNNSQVGGY